jgi:hypothetical protein
VTRDGAEKAAKLLAAIELLEAARHEMQVSGYPADHLLSDAANERIRSAVDAEIDSEISDRMRELSTLGALADASG